MDIEIFVFTIVLPLAAVCISFLAKSTTARRLLLFGGSYFFVAFSISLVLHSDCGTNDFLFHTCERLPQFFADFYSFPNLVNVAAYFFIAPILLMLACFLEVRARRKNP